MSDDTLINRLRCRYPIGPIGADSEPEQRAAAMTLGGEARVKVLLIGDSDSARVQALIDAARQHGIDLTVETAISGVPPRIPGEPRHTEAAKESLRDVAMILSRQPVEAVELIKQVPHWQEIGARKRRKSWRR